MPRVALDQSALLEVPDALKAADVGDRVPQAAEPVYQALIEAELTETIGAALHVAAAETGRGTAGKDPHRGGWSRPSASRGVGQVGQRSAA
jgi:putative transposase